MTKLEKLYSIIENSRDVGVKLTKDVLQQVEELEEKIIKDEILPALSQNIEPQLSEIQRDLVLVVEYHPGEPLSVALSRKTKISEIIDAKTLTPKSSKPVSSSEKPASVEPHAPTKHIENPTKGLRVTFPDGTEIWHKAAINTFVDALRKVGLDRISKVGIEHGGYNLVSKDKRPPVPGRIWQHEVDGWYIYSNISNETKVEDLKKISKFFKLGLKVEEGKPLKTPFVPVTPKRDNSNAILITPLNLLDIQGREMRITIKGRVFQEKKSVLAFVKALEYIGLDAVASVGIDYSGYNLVDTQQRMDDGKKWQHQVGNKWIYVYMSNVEKSKCLMKIAEHLKINIKIEAI